MAAEGLLPVSKLVFLGYPLHAPGKKTGRPLYADPEGCYGLVNKILKGRIKSNRIYITTWLDCERPPLTLFLKLPALHDFIL
jgi:hypothetical protein